MTLKVIGAGFGRTSTHSLKLALEQLGFGPCYHMFEVFAKPGRSESWEAIARGGKPDWDAIFAGYKSTVDWPSTHYWRELAAYYPDAKVILGERDPEKWYASISQTILDYMNRNVDMAKLAQADPIRAAQLKMGRLIVAEQTFGNRYDKAHVLDVYRRHNEEVKRTIAPSRLLVYDAPMGWEPLCRFLGVPVPSTPYPKTNSTEEFRARLASMP